MCPDSTLWLSDNFLKFIGRLGTIPSRLLPLRSNVLSCHNAERSGILPDNALFDKLNCTKLLKVVISAGILLERWFCDRSKI
jgi:hypothetical protein